MTDDTPRPLILASRSAARRQMLADVGLAFTSIDSGVDESALKRELQAQRAVPAEVAATLAEAKAVAVSLARPEALCIGADQVLAGHGTLFDKPTDLAEARAALATLSGGAHELISAVCVAADGAAIWHHADRASLWMRRLSDAALDDYLAMEGKAVLQSVGAYRLEGPGAQLFERIEGDYFTVLGLPLLPLLAFLRGHGHGLPA